MLLRAAGLHTFVTASIVHTHRAKLSPKSTAPPAPLTMQAALSTVQLASSRGVSSGQTGRGSHRSSAPAWPAAMSAAQLGSMRAAPKKPQAVVHRRHSGQGHLLANAGIAEVQAADGVAIGCIGLCACRLHQHQFSVYIFIW